MKHVLKPTSYADITYKHKNFMASFAHLKRNFYIKKTINSLKPKTILDYGAGDGELYKNLDLKNFVKIILFEPESKMFEDLKKNLKMMSNSINCIPLKTIKNISSVKFDLILCLEVLEHLPLPERMKFYKLCSNNLKKNGSCIIEVPIEYGPILLLKEFRRKYLKGRKTEYSIKELFLSVFFGKIIDKHNRFDLHDKRTFISPHHGFDFFKFLDELKSYGDVKFLYNSPFKFLPKIFNQSVVLRLKPR